jgi:AraC family transcriptional regulator of adaptative response / DNA-3-methyladenine glycosylase II
VTPIEYLQTCRLLLAKELLTDTGISMTDVAYASGFRSVRRFNTLFKKKYNLTPTSFRKKAAGKVPGEITVKVGYRKPFLYEPLLKFIADRAIEGMEKVEKGVYTRTISIRKGNKKYSGLLHISNNEKKSCLHLTISESLLPVLPELMAKVKNQFDLYASPEEIYEGLSPVNDIVPGAFVKGTRIPGSMDDFEICVRAIIGQLVSVKGARTTLRKFVEAFGEKTGDWYLFPTCEQFAGHESDITEMLGPLGITKMKACAIEGVARYLMENPGPFRDTLDVESKIKDLMEIRGIGKWTAEYISMRTMQNTNILLDKDYGIRKMLEAYPALEDKELQESWNPWKTYVTVGLWNLEMGG